ncbi:DUF6110 family protein [Gordonibacter sp. Marseille-P4307]|uniref:DUF6110 family protein n=1 Tax=Gordonibacter sp. Marseille-P4307 TaxID=2161815 RepID=UPI000F520DE6|nr:DUF6110 family protein [Gordonibacter sp. Marseille-P4307]
MKNCTRNALLVGGGFLAGTVGLKAFTSQAAKAGYVHALARGMKIRDSYENMVEQAKAEYDDIVAQATYINVEDAKKVAEEEN